MSVLIRLIPDGPRVAAALPEGAFKVGAGPFAPVDPARPNGGQGDGRTKSKPNIAWPTEPGVTAWEGGPYVRLADWLAAPAPGAAVILMPTDDPQALAGRTAGLAHIAVDFARFSDGRGLSAARLLRERVGWTGEIRAVGDVITDLLFYMARCGFDAFALRSDQPVDVALAAFATFPQVYQPAADARLEPVPA